MTLVLPYAPDFILGDGKTRSFPYSFDEVSKNFISMIIKKTDGSTYIPLFTVDLDSLTVTLTDSEPTPELNDLICIYRNTPEVQDVAFRTLDEYNAQAMENILSKIVAMIQETRDVADHQTVRTTFPQRDVSISELTDEHQDKMFFWDNEKKTITPTKFPYQDVVQCVAGLYLRVRSDVETNAHWLEWSKTGEDPWYSSKGYMDFAANEAKEAKDLANQAVNTSNSAVDTANQAKADAEHAVETSNQALDIANEAHNWADEAVLTANSAFERSYNSEKIAEESNEIARQAQDIAATANSTAEEAKKNADSVLGVAQNAENIANQASQTAADATALATGAVATASDAKSTAEAIAGTAQDALNAANQAKATASDAASQVAGAVKKADDAKAAADAVVGTAQNALDTANEAKQVADNALSGLDGKQDKGDYATNQSVKDAIVTERSVSDGKYLTITDSKSFALKTALESTNKMVEQHTQEISDVMGDISALEHDKQDKLTAVTTNTRQTIEELKSLDISQILQGANGAFVEGTMLPLWSSSDSYADFPVKDQNGVNVAAIRYVRLSNGTRGLQIIPGTASGVAGTPLSVFIDTNGVTRHTGITPPADSNSNEFSTTDWVRRRMGAADARELYAHSVMPAPGRVVMEVGASAAQYTAPFDGWIFASGVSTSAVSSLSFSVGNSYYMAYSPAAYDTSLATCFLPISKGQTFTMSYINQKDIFLCAIPAFGSTTNA